MLYACTLCGKRGPDRYCPEHRPKAWATSNRRSELPGNWERIRRAVLARDDICGYCTRAVATEVHHIGDKHDHSMQNLSGICGPCHKAITLAERSGRRVS